jgi:hypothetical protein
VLSAWWLAGLGVAAWCCVTAWRRRAQLGPVTALGLCLSALVVFGPVVHPWYLLWGIVALGAASNSLQIRRAMAIVSVALVLTVLPGGVDPNARAVLGGLFGVALVVVVLAAFSDVDRRQLRAPLVSGPATGTRPIAALEPQRPLSPVV